MHVGCVGGSGLDLKPQGTVTAGIACQERRRVLMEWLVDGGLMAQIQLLPDCCSSHPHVWLTLFAAW